MDLHEAEILTKEHMQKHNLLGWNFAWFNSKRSFGRCSPRRKLILLSRPFTSVNSFERVLDTILHEIAHALEFVKYNKVSHSYHWRRIALDIGCSAQRCWSPTDTVSPKGHLVYECSFCKKEICRHKRISHKQPIAHGECCRKYNGGKFDTKYLIVPKNC